MPINYATCPESELKGLSIRTPFNRRSRTFKRVDAEAIALRRLIAGPIQGGADARAYMQGTLERARLALGV